MRYEYFEFENFRGIRNAKVDLRPRGLDARVFTLVGLNESGKTTILEAIDYFQPTTEGNELSPKHLAGWERPDPQELVPISERTNFNGVVRIIVGVSLSDEDTEAIRKRVSQTTQGFRITELNKEIKITTTYTFKDSKYLSQSTTWPSNLGAGFSKTGSIKRQLTSKSNRGAWLKTVEAIRHRLPQVWYFPNFLFDFPEQIILTPYQGESDTNRFYRSLFQDLLDALDKNLSVDTHVVQRARNNNTSDANNLRQLLLELSREVSNSVVAAWSELFQNRDLDTKRVRIEVSSNASPTLAEDGKPLVAVDFSLEDSDGAFAIAERSLGFRWFFVYLLLTMYRGRRRKGQSDLLFLFDEPASNLHPRAQAALLHSLDRLSRNAFIVYTTHSHHLVDPRWLASTSVVINDGLDPTVISSDVTARRTDIHLQNINDFASQHPNKSYFFQPVLDMLDYAPSQLEMVPSVVMVEGKSDYFLLRYFTEVYRPKVARDISFLPGTGAGSLATVIQLYIAWGRPFVVLLDSDAGGRRAAQQYLDKFGPLVADRIVDLAEAAEVSAKGIESALGTENILVFQRVVNSAAVEPDKKEFTRGLQQAFATIMKVPISEGGVQVLETLLANLRAKMAELEH